ncbi:alpha-hydroxy acid oxidase [Rhodobaculum claviforme]|uniref:Alpha-hydroxy-acid oxidizing enzyme n=1 Tax=Rhodobaculum claviforme TaxID=1549854 RepID=A0A934TF64_9RHOB|nr:alpha-hydroxy acid oxidase [Rhodobaculum claviforme]MBK5926045.1 alpha-hydroxy-acid oxidizing enzyme [Rhodobaculum claviforme]
MSLDLRYPALSDLRAACRRRIPRFVWEYLDSATGQEAVIARNRAALDAVCLRPGILRGPLEPDLGTRLLGQDWAMPVGVAPLGMSGLIWPRAEAHLAGMAAHERLPYCLSTVATRLPEEIGPIAGDCGWFQLYPPRDPEIRRDILARARAAGFRVLVLTVDVPAPSRRERQLRARLTIPPQLTPAMLAQIALRPAWALGMARAGRPRLALMEGYARSLTVSGPTGSTAHVGYLLRTSPDWDYLRALRAEWDGALVVKGVLEPGDARALVAEGVDALWVSNHAGRQFEGAPASIDALPQVRAAVGRDVPVIFDGGVEGGLDILRALALGADFVMLGKAWHLALGALGARGPGHLASVLRADLIANLHQMGLERPADARGRTWPSTEA